MRIKGKETKKGQAGKVLNINRNTWTSSLTTPLAGKWVNKLPGKGSPAPRGFAG